MASNIQIDLEASKQENKEICEEKEAVQKNYQEASRVIAEQQRKLTECLEKLKVTENLSKIEEQTRAVEGQNLSQEWEEVWEDKDDESGDLVIQRRKELSKYQWKPELACKKCDKVLESDTQMRQHIKEHKSSNNELIKCHHCDFLTDNGNAHINHMVDIHSTKHTCNSCGEVFPTKNEWNIHVENIHGFKYNLNNIPNTEMECHDCDRKFTNKFELMQHKREAHYKKRLCSYWHGTGWGCRFPADQCLNIHNENITPELSSDNRSKIPCRDGESCTFNKKNSCNYKHTSLRSTPGCSSSNPDLEGVQ